MLIKSRAKAPVTVKFDAAAASRLIAPVVSTMKPAVPESTSIPPPAAEALILIASADPRPDCTVTPPTSERTFILATPVPWSACRSIVSVTPPLACK